MSTDKMHIALIFLGGIGFITLPCALINRALNARVGGKHGLFVANAEYPFNYLLKKQRGIQ